MSSWNHSICDDCWLLRCAEQGEIRLPVRIVYEHRDEDVCCYCTKTHMSGIFVRDDPKETGCTHDD